MKTHVSLITIFSLHAGLTGAFCVHLKCESINPRGCILTESKLIKENQHEVTGLIDVFCNLEAQGRQERRFWVRVMCPDGFIVAVKGAVLWTGSSSALVRWWWRWGNHWSSWREEMGEWRVHSCTKVNRRSLCALPTKKICGQLSASVSLNGIMQTFWVDAE